MRACVPVEYLSSFVEYVSAIGGEAKYVVSRDEWVSKWLSDGYNRIPILTQFWPDVSQCYLLLVSGYLSGLTSVLGT